MLSQPKYLHNRPRERVMPIGVGMKFNIALDAGFTRIPCLHRGQALAFSRRGGRDFWLFTLTQPPAFAGASSSPLGRGVIG